MQIENADNIITLTIRYKWLDDKDVYDCDVQVALAVCCFGNIRPYPVSQILWTSGF